MVQSEAVESTSETARIKALRKYEILDTPPDGSFDHVAQLAAQLFDVPIALVTLVDTDRIWFKSTVGLNIQEIGRDPGLCASAILSDDVYLVEDARNDYRTLANPLVAGEFGLQFYAAVPLKVREGYNLGTLCIIDKEPRKLSSKQVKLLEKLGQVLIDQLELRLEARLAGVRQRQLLNMVAHELKNPLTLIPVYADLIKKEPEVPAPIVQMSDHIRKASDRMQHLIKEVLDTANLQASEVHIKKSVFDMASVVGRAAAINLVLAGKKQQKLFVDLADKILVNADESKTMEIVDNLINNAIKYSPPGSSISARFFVKEGMAVFEICDEGPGLTADDMEQLFTPFTRLSARPTGGEHSTGMGLYIVKMLVDAQGGRVWGRNNVEKGACFCVEMPTVAINYQ
jgi:signal transduction histidine kinase